MGFLVQKESRLVRNRSNCLMFVAAYVLACGGDCGIGSRCEREHVDETENLTYYISLPIHHHGHHGSTSSSSSSSSSSS